jgi:formylglycine-generating enzyme required for sulfatase activity
MPGRCELRDSFEHDGRVALAIQQGRRKCIVFGERIMAELLAISHPWHVAGEMVCIRRNLNSSFHEALNMNRHCESVAGGWDGILACGGGRPKHLRGGFCMNPLRFCVALMAVVTLAQAADPVVSNVRASQRAGTQMVDVYYDVSDADSSAVTVSVMVSTNGGAGWFSPGASLSGALGTGIAPGSNNKITWSAGVDLPAKLFSNVRVSVTASDDTAPLGMVLIPAGSFVMGDTFSEGDADECPTHTVYVSAFYMDKFEVTKALWDEVYQWAVNHSYSFDNAGLGKAANHPVQTVSWYDCVKWCNARSEMEGRVPAYYTDAGLSTRYRSGQASPYVNWNAGYRLPTEAEWEKAARGGAAGQRFPWGNTITHSMANYYSYSIYTYDTSPTQGYHPSFQAGGIPYTSPVGDFSLNGYGLYDMAGNVWEWCWDWYSRSYYGSSPTSDPRGSTGSARVNRGGAWFEDAFNSRAADRQGNSPSYRYSGLGFRSALASGQ